jgi:hypothetical protein
MKHFLIIAFTLLLTGSIHAQLEKVIVEKYYITDSVDATDTTGGFIPAGSTTYRIYIDLKSGSKLIKLFGNAQHNLVFSSDSVFFNHTESGQTFAQDITKAKASQSTTALDSWLAIGQSLKKAGTKAYFGIPKLLDTDGSFIGGSNHPDGLLANTDPQAGIPLTTADGNLGIPAPALTYVHYGFKDVVTNEDTTIFGSSKKEFNSQGEDAYLAVASGVTGADPDSNQVLIAQLTTKGALKFELNLEVLDSAGKTITYVAKNASDSASTVFSEYLKYPLNIVCSCKDPHYLEYSDKAVCEDEKKCKTRIVCGCTDSLACNYDPRANVNIPALCCYPGFCNDRDINIVCPAVLNSTEFTLFPNPVEDLLTLQISGNTEEDVKYAIYDSYGMLKLEKTNIHLSGGFLEKLDVSTFPAGLYWVRVTAGGSTSNKLFMKK